MAATVANIEYNVIGAGTGGKWIYAEITLDSAYLPGGETVSAALLGLVRFKAVFTAFNEDGYIFSLSLNTAKDTLTIKVFSNFSTASNSAGTPVEASIQDLSAVVLPVLVRGV